MQELKPTKQEKRIINFAGNSFLASTLIFTSLAFAEDQQKALPEDAYRIEEIVVTAQKKAENLQDVPISISTLSDKALQDLNIKSFTDYVMQLPSVSSIQRRPGMGQLFMRGVSDGGNSNQSLQGPAVAIYVDESPVTAIGDNLDIHIYDIERIESLSGPQGTLNGAASEAGTLRIITNKPDFDEYDYGYDLSVETTSGGDPSTLTEAFVNIPLSENAAIRLVGFRDDNGGYIDSVSDSITFPLSGITRTNEAYVSDNFNESVNKGYRAALRIDLNDSWTLDASAISQQTTSEGVWDHDPDRLGDYKVARFFEDSQDDDWTKFTASITGDLGFADLTFTTSNLDRDFEVLSDYSNYSVDGYVEGYYTCYTSYFGDCVDPSIQFENDTSLEIKTHELRLASDNESRFNWIVGAFFNESKTKYNSQWHVPPIHPDAKVPTTKDLYYQTDQTRIDEETAFFAQLYYQVNDQLKLTLGHRKFDNETSLKGFVGTVWWPSSLLYSTTRPDNVNSTFKGNDSINKINLSYDLTENSLIYATYSEGYRPGGANRTTQLGASYEADFLSSKEIGFKSILMDGRLRLNGAYYDMDWDDIQLGWFDSSISLLGLVDNVGTAVSSGLELDLMYLINESLDVSMGYSNNDSNLTQDYSLRGSVRAENGQDLPFTPDTKFNVNLQYTKNEDSYGQINWVFTDEMWNDLFLSNREIQDSYSIVNASWTVRRGDNSLQFFVSNLLDEKAELYINSEDIQRLTTVNRPRSIGIKFSRNLNN